MVGVSALSPVSARFSPQELAVLAKLKATDRQVRAHEQAHLAVAGRYATSGATYTFAAGPDGNLYAVGGEVKLDVAADPSDPEATIHKARVIEAAANAPADPSGQDRRVAAAAVQMEIEAEQQLAAAQKRQLELAYGQPAGAGTGRLVSRLL